MTRKWYVVAGESLVKVALSVVRPLVAGMFSSSVESPYAVEVPYSKVAAVSAPCGSTRAETRALVAVTAVAGCSG